MKVSTYEGTVENGQIKLSEGVHLPEHAKVYVILPGVEETSVIHIWSPHLAKPEQAADFMKEVIKDPGDASLR